MNATPLVCPACGELVVAWPEADSPAVIIPIHPDRVTPFVDCSASARAALDGKIRLY